VSTVLRGGFGWMRRERASVMSELLVLMLIGYLGSEIRATSRGYRVVVRNFYGGMRVRDSGTAAELDSTRTLTHGTINHGEEYLNPARRHLATTYYGPNTGVGDRGSGKAADGHGAHRGHRTGYGDGGKLRAAGRLYSLLRD